MWPVSYTHLDYTNIAFIGSNVVSGSATAVAVCVGDHTLFGSMASAVAEEAVETSFTTVSYTHLDVYKRQRKHRYNFKSLDSMSEELAFQEQYLYISDDFTVRRGIKDFIDTVQNERLAASLRRLIDR